MPESENDIDNEFENEYEDTGPRFNKAILGRILAVGLFVALGTFAVAQSIRGNGGDPPIDLTGAAQGKLGAAADGLCLLYTSDAADDS